MAENKVEVIVGWEDKEFQAGLKEFYKNTDMIGKEIEQAFSSKPLEDFGKKAKSSGDGIFNGLVKNITVANLVTDGIRSAIGALVDFASGSVEAAQQQEDAINALSAALKRTGEFSRSAVDDFSAFASELQKTSIYGDETIISQLAVAKSFGATNEQAKNLVKAAVELSATFGGSLDVNVEKLGKTLQGSAGKLGAYLGEVKGLTTEQLKAGNAIDIVNSKLGGAGLAQTQTYSGAVISLKNAVSDLQEELGGLVTGSDLVKSGVTSLTEVFRSFGDAIAKSRAVSEANEKGFVESESKLNLLSERYADLTAEIEKQQQIINKQGPYKIADSGEIAIAQVRVKNLTQELNALYSRINTSTQAIKVAQAEADKAAAAEKTGKGGRAEQDKATNDQILAQRAQLNLDLAALQDQQSIIDAELEAQKRIELQVRNEEDLIAIQNFEMAKLELQYDAELKKAELIDNEANKRLTKDKINAQKEIAQKRLAAKQDIDIEKFRTDEKQKLQDGYLSATENFLQAGIMLTKKGSAEQKVLAASSAIINTYAGATRALRDYPAPASYAVAASVIALGLAQVAKINSQKFANGGIVAGSSFTGDKVSVGVNSGEMILNKAQQANLFRIANSGGGDGVIEAIENLGAKIANMQTIIQINSREIARAVRDERAAGFSV